MSRHSSQQTKLGDVKAHRKIAKFYGAKALTGTAKQKAWAESIRAEKLSSEAVSDEQKMEFLQAANFLQTAKFWINNKDLNDSYFTLANLAREYKALSDLYNKHCDTLARAVPIHEKEAAKIEIINQLKENEFQLSFTFPNFDPYNRWGIFEK